MLKNRYPYTRINNGENEEEETPFYYKQIVLESALASNFQQVLLNSQLPYQFILKQPIDIDYYRVFQANVPKVFPILPEGYEIVVKFVFGFQDNAGNNLVEAIGFPFKLLKNVFRLDFDVGNAFGNYNPGDDAVIGGDTFLFIKRYQYPDFLLDLNAFNFGTPVENEAMINNNVPTYLPNITTTLREDAKTGLFGIDVQYDLLVLATDLAIQHNVNTRNTPAYINQHFSCLYMEVGTSSLQINDSTVNDLPSNPDDFTLFELSGWKNYNVFNNNLIYGVDNFTFPFNVPLSWSTVAIVPLSDLILNIVAASTVFIAPTKKIIISPFNQLSICSTSLSSGQVFNGLSQISLPKGSSYGVTNCIESMNVINQASDFYSIYQRFDDVTPLSTYKYLSKSLEQLDIYITLPYSSIPLNFGGFSFNIILEILSRTPFS